MATLLQLLNRARNKNKQTDVDVDILTQGIQGALSNVEIVDEIVSYAYRKSLDWNFNEPLSTVTTVIGDTNIPTGGLLLDLDYNAIKEIKLVDGTNHFPLTLVTTTRADDLVPRFPSNSKPIYWYVKQGVTKLIPTPDSTYSLIIRYQGLVPEVSVNNINQSLALPRDLEKALVTGIYSRLLWEDGDETGFQQWQNIFMDQLSDAMKRNNSQYKKAGLKKLRFRRSIDFRY